tara:strand:- start:4326 stop:5108 length:783 start_codon:yes stop_codon:yes gene_type:complete
MINTINTAQSQPNPINAKQAQPPQKILYWIENERMGGSVPTWKVPENSSEKIESALSNAQYSTSDTFANTLSYTGQAGQPSIHRQEFGFSDLIDIVNPLQHIPVVGHLYREVTGDEINPVSNIIGGGIYGGASSAGTSLINAIIEGETGKDMAGNALSLLPFENKLSDKDLLSEEPQTRLNAVDEALQNNQSLEDEAFNNALLSFSNPSYNANKAYQIERISESETKSYIRPEISMDNIPERSAISEVNLSGLYALAASK